MSTGFAFGNVFLFYIYLLLIVKPQHDTLEFVTNDDDAKEKSGRDRTVRVHEFRSGSVAVVIIIITLFFFFILIPLQFNSRCAAVVVVLSLSFQRTVVVTAVCVYCSDSIVRIT